MDKELEGLKHPWVAANHRDVAGMNREVTNQRTRSTGQDRLISPIRHFIEDNRPRTIWGYLTAIFAGLALLVFIAVCGGDAFAPLREYLGLSHFMIAERGVYADCSRSDNRSNRFCQSLYQQRQAKKDEEKQLLRRPDEGLPFNLHDD